MDGILETPGRILVMTTNKPDILDKALIRPGRIDLNIEVGACTNEMIKDIYNNFYDFSVGDKRYKEFNDKNYDNKITPAELNKILLNNYNNSENSYNDILDFLA